MKWATINKKRNTGLVVMGGDSRSEGCGFESRHHIQVVKLYCLFEKGENKQKEEHWSSGYGRRLTF